jgi:uncharacterized protein
VREAVAPLPDRQRAAVLLFYLAGLTYREAATALGVDVSAVRTRLHNARQNLRQVLTDMRKEEEMSAAPNAKAVEVRVADVWMRPEERDARRYHIILLQEVGGERRLPIWVGQAEGTAIALQIEGVKVPRPLTYSFMAEVLKATGSRLREVLVSRLAGDTFYAEALIEGPRGSSRVDARPSDALSLALATGARLLVDESVFEAAESHVAYPEATRDLSLLEGRRGTAEIVEEVKSRWPDVRRGKRG